MKKFLEVLIDDNDQLHIETEMDFSQILDPDHPERSEGLIKAAIKAWTECIWKDRNNEPSKAVRLLSMAEIAATAEPYNMAEEFWSTMMFSYLPHYEKFCDKVKSPYGFDTKLVIRPKVFGNPGAFMSGSIFPININEDAVPKNYS
ncbi:MAG: hypothetical protein J5640_06470 [Bacteroidales bacterium]|nr:hypothetical protein [Bacteroidales bacterium]